MGNFLIRANMFAIILIMGPSLFGMEKSQEEESTNQETQVGIPLGEYLSLDKEGYREFFQQISQENKARATQFLQTDQTLQLLMRDKKEEDKIYVRGLLILYRGACECKDLARQLGQNTQLSQLERSQNESFRFLTEFLIEGAQQQINDLLDRSVSKTDPQIRCLKGVKENAPKLAQETLEAYAQLK